MDVSPSISTTFNFLPHGPRRRDASPLCEKAYDNFLRWCFVRPSSRPPPSLLFPLESCRCSPARMSELTSDVRQDAISKSPPFRPGVRLFLLTDANKRSFGVKNSAETPSIESHFVLAVLANLFLLFFCLSFFSPNANFALFLFPFFFFLRRGMDRERERKGWRRI